MTKVMEKYSSYKDSGVQWLGEIPSHWETKRLNSFGIFSKGGGISRDELQEEGKSAILYGDIYTKYDIYADTILNHISEEVAAKSVRVFCGDILMTGSGETKEDIGKTVVVREQEAYIGGDVILFRQNTNNSSFLSYALNSQYAKDFRYRESKGEIIVHIYANNIKQMYLPLPPLSEQDAIVSYLDTVTTQIDTAIFQQQKMIELLNERKQIIINNAVTKGLDPNVKMKDSGVDWIGEIPEGWEVRPIKHFKSKEKNAFVDGPFGSNLKSEHYVENGDVYVIESGMVTTGKFVKKDFKSITFSHFKTIERSECKPGDVIIAKIGAKFGMAAELPDLGKRCVVSGNSLKLSLDQKLMINSLFVCYMGLAKIRNGFIGLYQETAQPALSLGGLNNMLFPVPPLNEQIKISQYLDTKISKIDAIVTIFEKQITLLQERKQIIINEVVTGKVKVS